MSISQYQYERLEWLLENKELNLSELTMIDNMIMHWREDDQFMVNGQKVDSHVEWLLGWLRSKPSKKTHGSFAMRAPGCPCPLCAPPPWNAP